MTARNFKRLLAAIAAGSGAAAGAALPAPGALTARWSADDITPQTDNTALASWTDGVGGFTASQATGANQPVYRAARLNGKPSVQFTGTRWLAGAMPGLKTVIDTRTYTVMIVLNGVATVAQGTLFGNAVAGAGFYYQATGATVGRFDGGNVKTSVPWANAGFMTFGTSSSLASLYSPQSSTGNEFLYVRGMRHTVGQSANAPGPLTSSASGSFGIGARDDTGANACKADIYEIIVWNRVLTDVEWAQAEAWACAKYGQTPAWASLASLDAYVGDSITAGVGSNDATKAYPYLSAVARTRGYGQWTNQSCGGTTWAGVQAKIANLIDLANYLNLPLNVVAFEWYNEKNTGNNATQAWTHAQAYISALRAASAAAGRLSDKIGLMSSTCYTGDAADPYATVRGAYNALLDGSAAALVDCYQPIHSDATAGPLIGDGTAFATNGATYGFGDGVHLNVAGYAVLAPVGTACLNAMRA